MKHICRESNVCVCSISALEPDEQCPVHGAPWPPRCCVCGKWMKWPNWAVSEVLKRLYDRKTT